jgi:CheY-like chemotaxis protein
VLIADDEPDIRALVADVLRRADLEVVEAADAEQTMTSWRQHRPAVIVLDHLMPPVSGFDLAEQILRESPNQVIFLFTALLDTDVRERSERLGITRCLPKERVFDLPELVRDVLNPT